MLFNVAAAEDVRCAVVGHVEVVEFARVDHVPRPGEIVQAHETWTEPAGGGAVAATALQRLASDVIFFTAFGDDEVGRRAEQELRARGLRIECVYRDEPQRRGFTYLDCERRADDHRHRPQARPARGRSAPVGGAGRSGRRLPLRR